MTTSVYDESVMYVEMRVEMRIGTSSCNSTTREDF